LRVHDAVRRANPNQFVMTLFSSRASRAAPKRDFVECVCVYKHVLNIHEMGRSYLLRTTRSACVSICMMPPVGRRVFISNLHGAR